MVVNPLPAEMETKPKQQTNWSANITYTTNILHEVTSSDQIQALLRSHEKVKVAGTAHTFNAIADTAGIRLSLKLMPEVLHLNAAARTVTVSAGIRYDQLCPVLHRHGFALPNLASFMELSVVGACSTAAHGSGDKCGNLATAISALEMVTSNGDVVKLSREADAEIFPGAVVGLSALGIVTNITLDLQPAFTMRQYVYENLPLAAVKAHFDTIMSTAYSVSLFTDWQGERMTQVWIKIRDNDDEPTFAAPESFFGATRQTTNLNMTFGTHVEHCTQQMGIPGPTHERLPHFRVGFLAPVGNELQSEYFLPRHHAVNAIMAVESLRDDITPHLFISEIRTIAADDLWMSTCYDRNSVAIHFTWKHDWAAVRRVLPLIELALAPFDPRPHWGKLFAMTPQQVQSKYARLDEFRRLAAKFDPHGKFRNAFLDSHIFTAAPSPPP
ncbi:hypothetical protein M758_3G037900 [Ceratodon purpureus]|nr:hypothetical protein M758_3G037900 [Ceratodon purpureus]